MSQMLGGDAALVFLQHVLGLFDTLDYEKGDRITCRNTSSSSWEATCVFARRRRVLVDISWSRSSKTSEEPDPRQFGDTAAVTARAMQDWYPGKTSTVRWDHLTVKALGKETQTRYMDRGYSRDGTEWSCAFTIQHLVEDLIRKDKARQLREREEREVAGVEDLFARVTGEGAPEESSVLGEEGIEEGAAPEARPGHRVQSDKVVCAYCVVQNDSDEDICQACGGSLAIAFPVYEKVEGFADTPADGEPAEDEGVPPDSEEGRVAAISPDEAALLTPRASRQADALCLVFNGILNREYADQQYVTVAVSRLRVDFSFGTFLPGVVDEVIHRFREAGWYNTKFTRNQRDGDWFHFER